MKRLAKSMITGNVIDDKYIKMMAKNRTGKLYIYENDNKKKYIQYLGFLCYSKNPVLANSEVFHALSGRSIGSGGWTGTQFTVDPINQLYFFLESNRSHNRVTSIAREQESNIIFDGNKRKTIVIPNGDIKVDTRNFASARDEVVHTAIKLAIQYKTLEYFLNYNNEIDVEEKKVRKI